MSPTLGLGIVHNDARGRQSMALDLVEPVRPEVVLDMIERRTFRKVEFVETADAHLWLRAPSPMSWPRRCRPGYARSPRLPGTPPHRLRQWTQKHTFDISGTSFQLKQGPDGVLTFTRSPCKLPPMHSSCSDSSRRN
jgi:hypothetical protein